MISWRPDGAGGYKRSGGVAILCKTGHKSWSVVVQVNDTAVTRPIKSKKATFDHADAIVAEVLKEHTR